ncbi:MAG: aspartyl/asparaginyl beta-hydroxylase domain-containing protein [Alphaproteobacteria bacterium]|nr:aspartyl/asparaginyl beta-hydroxylase domain-containing protein [Alphaproteobacteria bacterium]
MTTPFPNWHDVCPQLAILEARFREIRAELDAVRDGPGWFPWVENDLYDSDVDWQILPIYGFDKLNVDAARALPRTCAALAQVPGLRTALFSRISPMGALNPHLGPPLHSNFVLRAQLGVDVPGEAGVVCDGEERLVEEGRVLMFDDLLLHTGFNRADRPRTVLICDVDRPGTPPLKLERPQWGVTAPDWPPGWEEVGRRVTAVRARAFAAGLQALTPGPPAAPPPPARSPSRRA